MPAKGVFKNTREDFWRQVVKTDGCWVWVGKKTRGYGYFYFEGKAFGCHRFSYMELVGPIPRGLELDHLCRNTACVRPSHLEPVTHRQNILRSENFAGKKYRQTHCIRGHEFTLENTGRTNRGTRLCRKCDVIHTREYRARRKERQ